MRSNCKLISFYQRKLKSIISFFKKTLRLLGIDRAIAYTVATKIWAALAGFITLILVASKLSPDQQGYYYTFSSILGLQIFFELGLSFVILQFASHEKAKLEWSSEKTLEGDPTAKKRLSFLLKFSLKCYGIISILACIIIVFSGIYFFHSHQNLNAQVNWQIPWIWFIIAASLSIFLTSLCSFLEGCGLVANVAVMRLGQLLFANAILWAALSAKYALYSVALFKTGEVIWSLSWLLIYPKKLIKDLLNVKNDAIAPIDWKKEIWPFQWRISLSWFSGYFIFQLFSPVLFAYYGAKEAGKMGMSIAITSGISSIPMAWISTKTPTFASLIAHKKFQALDKIFFRSLLQSFFLLLFGSLLFWIIFSHLNSVQSPFTERLLSPLPFGLLLITCIVNYIVFAEAIYLRAHKQEPFLSISVFNGCLTGLSSYFLGRYYGSTGMMAGYLFLSITIGLVGGTYIFLKKRKLWHV